MSALTLPSITAPSATSVPKGSPGEAVSGFRNLLAALSGESGTTTDEKTAAPAPAPAPAETLIKAEADASAVPGFLAAPPPPPTPLVLPASTDEAAGDPDGAQSTTPLLVEEDPTAKTTAPEVLPREQTGKAITPEVLPPERSITPLLGDRRATGKTIRPEVLPPLPAVPPLTGETPDTELTLAETAAAQAALEARARTGATPVPTSPPPTVMPLRPASERTGRLTEPPVVRTAEGVRTPDTARSAAAAAPPVPAAGPTTTPADFIAMAIARDIANGGEADEPAPEPALPIDSATTQTQAQTAARETGVSQLSRATIEATAQIAAQILRRLEGRSTRFEMALTPDELGRVDVKLDIDNEGRLNARLAFDNPAAATDLRGRADELRRQLEDAGFHLADDAFEFTERDSNSSAFDRGQDARDGSSRAFAAATRLNTEIDVAQPPRWLALSLSPSGVDMKV
jgi:flagellar hook-length control protein FliK